jgi:ABC-type nitrate/sulfonate/bicarbonate transport system permease component
MDDTAQSGQNKLFSAVLRLNTKMLGMVLGLLFGFAIFIATNWLIIKGGHITPGGEYVVGPHLQLLSQFFIGYRVSFLGSIIGFFYGFALGTLCGAAIGWIYNKIAVFRNSEIKNM